MYLDSLSNLAFLPLEFELFSFPSFAISCEFRSSLKNPKKKLFSSGVKGLTLTLVFEATIVSPMALNPLMKLYASSMSI
jgi:hypothetical protein